VSIYLIPAFTLLLASVAGGLVFHYHRPAKKRSPEAAVAAFSAILAVGVWITTISGDLASQAREQQRENEGRAAAQRALARADAQAAARDRILARNIEDGFRRAGLSGPATVLRDIRLGQNRPQGSDNDIASARRIAELETEQRMAREQRQSEAEAARAASRSFMRRVCERELHKNSEQCVEFRRRDRQEAILDRLEGNSSAQRD